MKQMFDGQEFEVIPTHDPRQWYMAINEVATAYGVTEGAIYNHLSRHADELRDGIEKGVTICETPGGPQQITVLFREGVIKLGFFVRSPQAAAFRQFATNLVVQHLESIGVVTPAHFQEFMGEIRGIVTGLKQEVDELRDVLNLFLTDTERTQIQTEINLTKAALNMDGRAVVAKVRATLNTSAIYNVGLTKQVINCLRVMRGEGIVTVK
jgi:prophage antirepressor-like protein